MTADRSKECPAGCIPQRGMDTSNRQIMGMMFSADWLNHPDRAVPALAQTRDGGFGTIIGFVRHMHHTVTHEHVRRAVTRTAENCHKLGLKFALDMDWAHGVDWPVATHGMEPKP
jgi:hypothetical protein